MTEPAVLGGHPAFDSLVPVVRPELPPAEELFDPVREVVSSRVITNHKYVREFEKALARTLGVKHAVCVSSCTSGMMLLMRGLALSGEIVVPSFTFMATVAAVVWAGCEPVFADVDEQAMVLDPDAVEEATSPRTCAILAVHNFGRPAPVERLEEIARSRGVRLLFDAAHGLGSLRKGGPLGGLGEAEVFSFSPTKLVTAAEGGVVTTDSDEIAEAVRVGRNYGNPGNYDCVFPGLSARMSEFNAILGLASLRRLDAAVARRNELARLYCERLRRLPGISFQAVDGEDRSSYKDFTVVIDEAKSGLSRDALAWALRAENIDTRSYFDPPCHRMAAFGPYVKPGQEFPRTEKLSAGCLSLPIWSGMDLETASKICLAVERILEHAPEIGGAAQEVLPESGVKTSGETAG